MIHFQWHHFLIAVNLSETSRWTRGHLSKTPSPHFRLSTCSSLCLKVVKLIRLLGCDICIAGRFCVLSVTDQSHSFSDIISLQILWTSFRTAAILSIVLCSRFKVVPPWMAADASGGWVDWLMFSNCTCAVNDSDARALNCNSSWKT